MITKLRRNFILVTMCSTFAVIAVIIGALNLISYKNMVDQADDILELLIENDASFPAQHKEIPGNPPDKPANQTMGQSMKGMSEGKMAESKPQPPEARDDKKNNNNRIKEMSPETPYETRFFSVRLSTSNKVLSVDTGKIAAVVTEDAVAYAREVLESGNGSGFYESYRYKVVDEEDAHLLLFVDRSRELSAYRTLAVASVSVSLIGLLAVFILVLIFSKIVFKPVAASYEKQKRFITDASHELKTPLTIISANVEVLEMEAEENNWTKSIKNQVSRLTTLVQQMVTLSRMDESRELQSCEEFSLTAAVVETVELFEALADSQQKLLNYAIDEEYSYRGDEKQIRQMVSLLLDNAVKYSNPGGTIRLRLTRKGKHYQLTVWNTVDDIPKGKLDVLFERFYRLDSSRNSALGGSGIGLSIVKSIVEAHKGKISANSEDGKSLTILAIL